MSTEFHRQSWDQRFTKMGDEAESAFERNWPKGWVRTGLDRPPLQMHRLPLVVRYTPDYLTTEAYFEVQGCGKGQTFRIKTEKLEALLYWDGMHPVRFWFWNGTTREYTSASLGRVYREWKKQDEETYPELKTYRQIPVSVLGGWSQGV